MYFTENGRFSIVGNVPVQHVFFFTFPSQIPKSTCSGLEKLFYKSIYVVTHSRKRESDLGSDFFIAYENDS